jgi:hypothetical protein
MITITQGPGTFQRPIVRWIEEVPAIPAQYDEQGNIVIEAVAAIPGKLEKPTNEDGTPLMENCAFSGFLLRDAENAWVVDQLKAVVNGNSLDIYDGGTKLSSYPNTPENLAIFEDYLSDGLQPVSTLRAERQRRKAIGQEVIDTYLDDNEEIGLTTAQSLAQLQKFQAVKALLEVGSIGQGKRLADIGPNR